VTRRAEDRAAFAIGVSAAWSVGLLLVVPTALRLPWFCSWPRSRWRCRCGQSGRNTAWHPQHIAERYGLFTLIVLGETVLSSTAAVQRGLAGGTGALPLLGLRVCGLVIVFGMWWVYFGQRAERFLRSNRQGFRWGYGHFLIFSSPRRWGRDGVAVDHTSPRGPRLRATVAGAGGRGPVAAFLFAVWLLHVRPQHPCGPPVWLCVDRRAHPARGTDPVGAAPDALLVAALVATSVVADARPRPQSNSAVRLPISSEPSPLSGGAGTSWSTSSTKDGGESATANWVRYSSA
jgi:hypothetical protein